MDETSLPPIISARTVFCVEGTDGFGELPRRLRVVDGTPFPVLVAVVTGLTFAKPTPAFDIDVRLHLPDDTMKHDVLRSEPRQSGQVGAVSRYMLPLLGRYDVFISIPGHTNVATAVLEVE